MPAGTRSAAPGDGVPGAASARTFASGLLPTVTDSVVSAPLRQSVTGTVLPLSVSATWRARSDGDSMAFPFQPRMMSPLRRPAAAAGLFGSTEDSSVPRGFASPKPSARSSVTGWMRTPSQPRDTRPSSRRSATTVLAMLDGTAKPMPTLPPLGEKMAVLTPITSPRSLKVGPPELPRLMGASICKKSTIVPPWRSRPRAETMPAVTEPPRPNGLPTARTQSPTRTRSESPNATCGSGSGASILSRARSVLASRPTSRAG